ncbi:MAG: mevalonate kinase [Anaerolineales bacterium]|jgi:mevalonate kinase
MPAISASAPGKIILFGEHAVVYGQPALAVPVKEVQVKVIIRAEPGSQGINILAPEIALKSELAALPLEDALGKAIRLTLDAIGVGTPPACTMLISSTIPLAGGMGSGAAVSVAIIRALSGFLGRALPDETVNELAYEVEKLHHGTPSGIDNTVVTYAKPVYFIRGKPVKILQVRRTFTLVIGDSGIVSPTSRTVADVRKAYDADTELYENYFNVCGIIARKAEFSIQDGRIPSLGPMMDDNHEILSKMGVSCPELDRLVVAAREAGAMGAKLSGGGRGGNMIALVEQQDAQTVADALQGAGAVRTIITQVV